MTSVDKQKNISKRKLHYWGFSFFITFLIFGIVSCSDTSKKVVDTSALRYEIDGEAQGTTYHIVYFTDSLIVSKLAIDSILDDIDMAASIWVDSSIISRVNHMSGDFLLITDDRFGYFKDNFLLSKEVYYNTNGAYNPTVGELVNAWGFGFKNREHMDSLKVDSMLQSVGFNEDEFWVTTTDGVVFHKLNSATNLDFNGIAQGYSVDVLGDYFQSIGILNYMIEVGGELIAHGVKGDSTLWRIGIDKPEDRNMNRELKAILELNNMAVATSGNYRKFYESNGVRYAHTIDPNTGFPVQHSLLSVTVVMGNCGLADAYATSFMVMGFEKSKALVEARPELEMDAYFIYTDDQGEFHTYFTPNLNSIITEL